MTEKEQSIDKSWWLDNSQAIKLIPGISEVSSYVLYVDKKPMRFYKISYHGSDLDVPIFENGNNIVERISQFLTKMSTQTCRKELFQLWNTCSVDIRQTRNWKIITTWGPKAIVSPNEFSAFVGIDIVWWEYVYESIRHALAKQVIDTAKNKVAYSWRKTMIEDFSDWWSGIPKEKIHFSYKKDDNAIKTAKN